jgi:2-phosphosulfolactate phosphatase
MATAGAAPVALESGVGTPPSPRAGPVRADAWFGAAEALPSDVAGRVVAVIDVLRASTTIAAALAHGARAVIPCATVDEVSLRAKALDRSDLLLAGERRMRPIPGFALGNSPAEFTEAAVDGTTILLVTTNGTPALVSVHGNGAADVVIASYVNLSAVLVLLRTALRGGTDIALLCAGHDGRFALEDALCAGELLRMLADGLPALAHNDAAEACLAIDRRPADPAARLAALLHSEHGRALADAGFGADVALSATLDAFPVVPIYRDHQIMQLGPDRSR